MPADSFLQPPKWVSDPLILQSLLTHSLFTTPSIDNCVDLDDPTQFNQGVKQFMFWRRELTPSVPANTVIFALLGPSGLEVINVLEVFKALKEVCNMSLSTEYFQGANTKFVGVSFTHPSEVTKIINNFLYFKDSVVSFVTYHKARSLDFRLLWLPPQFPIEKVQHMLNKYCLEFNTQKESIKVDDDRYMDTCVVKGQLVLRQAYSIDTLPHMVKLPAPHHGSALILIKGRPSICLKCRNIGHVRKNCTFSKCKTCSKFHSSTASCPVGSYSSKLQNNITSEDLDNWPQDIDDVPPMDFFTNSSTSADAPNLASGGYAQNFPAISVNNDFIVAPQALNDTHGETAVASVAEKTINVPSKFNFHNVSTGECSHTLLAPPASATDFPSSKKVSSPSIGSNAFTKDSLASASLFVSSQLSEVVQDDDFKSDSLAPSLVSDTLNCSFDSLSVPSNTHMNFPLVEDGEEILEDEEFIAHESLVRKTSKRKSSSVLSPERQEQVAAHGKDRSHRSRSRGKTSVDKLSSPSLVPRPTRSRKT